MPKVGHGPRIEGEIVLLSKKKEKKSEKNNTKEEMNNTKIITMIDKIME